MTNMTSVEDWLSDDGAAAWLALAAEGARESFEKDGECEPVVLMLARRRPDCSDPLEQPAFVVMPLTMPDDGGGRDAVACEVRMVAERCHAISTAMVTEVWLAPPGTTEQQLHESVGAQNIAGYQEGVTIFSDHLTGGQSMLQAIITRDADGRPTLGEFGQPTGVAGGRFAGLLPPSCYGCGPNVVEA